MPDRVVRPRNTPCQPDPVNVWLLGYFVPRAINPAAAAAAGNTGRRPTGADVVVRSPYNRRKSPTKESDIIPCP